MDKIRGLAWHFGDNIDTDQIIPARYCNTFDPDELSDHAMEGTGPEFPQRVAPGDIIVAGRNFGCGSSREAAPLALKASGVGAIIAHSFSRLFFRNAANIGLYILVCQSASQTIETGEELLIDKSSGVIHSISTGRAYRSETIPEYIQEIIDAGGMISYVKQRVSKKGD